MPDGFVTPAAACWMYLGAVAEGMRKISYAGYRFPPEVIHQAIWLYLRFTLSFRDVEDLLAEREIAVLYETVRRWVNHFGPMIAAHLRKRRPKPHATWHLDEVYLKIDGRMVYLWRAVDAEGEVLDVLVQIPPGSAIPSSRAAILTPSPIRSPSLSSTTSPRWMPIRNSMRLSDATPALRSTIALWTSVGAGSGKDHADGACSIFASQGI